MFTGVYTILPKGGGEESTGLRASKENQRKVRKKGTESKARGTKEKEGAKEKLQERNELRQFRISLIIHPCHNFSFRKYQDFSIENIS